ncbi:hypothetical protein JFU03_05755 [Bacillus sp. TH44]|uniref:hypothetical protein n=1 Tax=unclassified Bacillus (in: firmicutes) TaxID=185979 RepID=UPI001911B130|nr:MULTISPECIES: hypothetical protein [unclassified Bacillus (in: firmicutes)]MBK5349136.1 hypothetical protein [Bacillus sp. TH45]MBK5357828.1 hypothetical protein [Bacillus sp. TH44]MBK5363961.1 hypothetical protein [Bacillus sp. TH50]
MEKVKAQAAETKIETQEEEINEDPMLTNEEAKAMFTPKMKEGMIYARVGRIHSKETYSTPQPQVVRGMAMARNIVG